MKKSATNHYNTSVKSNDETKTRVIKQSGSYDRLYDPEDYAGLATTAERLRYCRESAKLTREALSKMSGISVVAIQYLETGRRKNIQSYTANALARPLGISPEYLLGLSDHPNVNSQTHAVAREAELSPAFMMIDLLRGDDRVKLYPPVAYREFNIGENATPPEIRADFTLADGSTGYITESDINSIMDDLRDGLVFQLWRRTAIGRGQQAIVNESTSTENIQGSAEQETPAATAEE